MTQKTESRSWRIYCQRAFALVPYRGESVPFVLVQANHVELKHRVNESRPISVKAKRNKAY